MNIKASCTTACVAAPHTLPAGDTNFKTDVQDVCGMHARVLCRSHHCFKLSDDLCFISGNEYNNAQQAQIKYFI